LISKEKQIAYCGIVCSECLVFITTQSDDNEKRKEIAEKWTKESNHSFKPEDINCDGCLSETGKIIGYSTICEIRKCGWEKQIANCAYCNSYICEKLDKFFKRAQKGPTYKTTLDKIKAGLK
jgi:hypothetical protein